MHCDDDEGGGGGGDEYTNLCNLCFLLFLFIYPPLLLPSPSFSFLLLPSLYHVVWIASLATATTFSELTSGIATMIGAVPR